MKKFLKIGGGIVAVLLLLMVLLPIVFKGKIVALVKDQANQNLNAKMDFQGLKLSLFKSFPNFSADLQGLSLAGIGTFEGDTLLKAGNIGLTLDLMSVISGKELGISRIDLSDIYLNVRVLKDGQANYNILKTDSAATETPIDTTAPSPFKLKLKRYNLSNFNLKYQDEAGNVSAQIDNLNHQGKGDFTQEVVQLATKTQIDGLSVAMDGLQYLKKAKIQSVFDLTYEGKTGKISFGENSIELNALALNFNGWLQMLENGLDMDLNFNAPNTEFKSVLSLIPAVFMKDFQNVKTAGNFLFKGMAKGKFPFDKEDVLPAFDVQLNVNNASFQYPDLPASVRNIAVDLNVNNPGGSADATKVNLKKFAMLLADNPIDAKMMLRTPVSDPDFDFSVLAKIDLANLKKVIPVEGTDYQGKIDADMAAAGKMSSIQNERYDEVSANGGLSVEGIVLKNDSLPFAIELKKAAVRLSPQFAEMPYFEAKMGKSDVSAKGRLDNLLGYAFSNEVLKGNLEVYSQLLDLNELSGAAPKGNSTDTASQSPMEVVRIPQNIDLVLKAKADQILYTNLNLKAFSGQLMVHEGLVEMQNVGMQLLEGSVKLEGAYNSVPDLPIVNMKMSLDNFSFKSAYETFGMVKKLAPIMEKAEGSFSCPMQFESVLKSDMMPDLNTVEAKGRLHTKGLKSSPDVMKKAADLLKDPKYAQINTGLIDVDFTISQGRVAVKPFNIKVGGVDTRVEGSSGLDQSIDYNLDLKVPTQGLANSGLLSNLGALGSALPAQVDLKLKIGGSVQDPKITSSLGSLGNSLTNNLKEQATQLIEEKVEEVKEDLNKKAQELIDAAEKQGDALVAEAQKKADELNIEAKKQGDALRAEADKQAKKLEADAKGNFLKEAGAKEAAKRIRKEADDKAKKLEAEAAKQGQALVEKAKAQKAQLVEDARAKAAIK